jgi:hypothetical protein
MDVTCVWTWSVGGRDGAGGDKVAALRECRAAYAGTRKLLRYEGASTYTHRRSLAYSTKYCLYLRSSSSVAMHAREYSGIPGYVPLSLNR